MSLTEADRRHLAATDEYARAARNLRDAEARERRNASRGPNSLFNARNRFNWAKSELHAAAPAASRGA